MVMGNSKKCVYLICDSAQIANSDAREMYVPYSTQVHKLTIQGGPAKVRPTYIFDGNI